MITNPPPKLSPPTLTAVQTSGGSFATDPSQTSGSGLRSLSATSTPPLPSSTASTHGPRKTVASAAATA
jgi:hypothetical protein